MGSFWTPFKFVVTVYLGKKEGKGGEGEERGWKGERKRRGREGEWKRGKGEEEEGECVKVNKNVVQTLTFHS